MTVTEPRYICLVWYLAKIIGVGSQNIDLILKQACAKIIIIRYALFLKFDSSTRTITVNILDFNPLMNMTETRRISYNLFDTLSYT